MLEVLLAAVLLAILSALVLGGAARAARAREARLREAFRAMSAEALGASNEAFLRLAETRLEASLRAAEGQLAARQEAVLGVVKPLQDALQRNEAYAKDLEEKRQKAYGTLDGQLQKLSEAQASLQRETTSLATALRNPSVRGRWGEMALRRAVELAGMSEHCDFDTQVQVKGPDGPLRPDLVLRLPAGRVVVVDAKAPLKGYMEALQSTDPAARDAALADFAQGLRGHARGLASKAYWAQFESSPEFVVMFLPGEFLASAAAADATLLEDALADRVLLATPTTLIALLWAAAQGWREERVAANAAEVSRLGRELYERLQVATGHLGALGRSLEKSVEQYNRFVGSYESRVLASARRFEDMGAAAEGGLAEQEPVALAPRSLRALEAREA